MAMALPLSCLLLAAMLISGCASEPRPQQGLQGAIVGGTAQMIGAVETAKNASGQAGTGVNCTLDVSPATVKQGGKAIIRLSAKFSGERQFDLHCGGIVKSLMGEGGSLAFEGSCTMGEPGFQKITLSTGGQECASAIVDVEKGTEGRCSVDGSGARLDAASGNYLWNVRLSGFAPGDRAEWVCGGKVFGKELRADIVWGMPPYEELSCSQALAPSGSAIPVAVAGVPCGEVAIR